MYFGPSISVGRRGVSYGDSDAQAFIAATGLTGTTEVNAVNNLVANLKQYGLWSKMKAIYPFVSDTVNLLSYSEDFSNGVWTKQSGVTVTANSTTAPDGTLTADLVNGTTGTNGFLQPAITVSGTSPNTKSIYIKGVIGGEVVRLQDPSQTIGFTSCTLTTSWQRFTLTETQSSGGAGLWVTNIPTTGIYVWGAQLEQSSSATTYQPIATTSANRFVSQFKYNLKDPRDLNSAYRLAFNGNWSYSKQGATGNGSNAYADTYFIPNTALTINSGHATVYSRTQTPKTTNQILRVTDGTNDFQISPNINVAGFGQYSAIGGTQVVNVTNTDARGFYQSQRTSATSLKSYKDTTLSGTNTTSGTHTYPNLKVYIGCANVSNIPTNYSDIQVAFSSLGDGLSDTEATNLYTSVQQFNQDLSRQVGVPIVSDADAQSFLNAAQITDLTQANAINTLVVGLKNASLWTKMKAIYPFVGGTATSHKWNLKDPRDLDAAYRLAFFGAWTHSSTGATPNGVNGYADTYYLESANATLNSGHISYYSRTNIAGNPFMGASNGTTETNIYPNNGGTFYPRIQATNSGVPSVNLNAAAYFIASRINATEVNGYRNTTKYTVSNPTVSLNNLRRYYLGAGNDSTIRYNANQTAFSTIGDGLNDSEASTLYTLVQNFQTTLGRQV